MAFLLISYTIQCLRDNPSGIELIEEGLVEK